MTPTANPRTEQLVRARKRDSETKRKRALDTVHRMLDSGQKVGFTSVARQAHVSTWLLYSAPELKHAVERAIEIQARGPVSPSTPKNALPESISVTELALARSEIKELRAANGKLTARLRATLGAELDSVNRQELIDRVHELEQTIQDVHRQQEEAESTAKRLKGRVAELDEEVAVLDSLNKKYIREINLSRRKA
jgi:hypothetical protein